MSITVQNKLNVTWVSLTATVLSSSKYGQQYDRVKVLHEVGLQAPLTQDETFFIPHATAPLDTREAFPDGNITNFAGQRFGDLKDEFDNLQAYIRDGQMDKADEVYKLLRQTGILSRIVVKKGTRVLTFEYELALYPGEQGIFNLQIWAPMTSFAVVQGGQVVANLQVPGSAGEFASQMIEAAGFIPDAQGNPTQPLQPTIAQDLGLRRVYGWKWQNDPLFRIKYRYAQ